MDTPNAPVELVAHDSSIGQRIRWVDALRDVWLGVTTPEALEIQVIWSVTPSDGVIQMAIPVSSDRRSGVFGHPAVRSEVAKRPTLV